jgi:hypothetical protein
LHATAANSVRTAACKSLLEELNEERQKARMKMKMMFNESFGATFLTSTGQESAFAYNIHQYADVYTSKPENFLLHSPEAWLHVPFDVKIMPHHVKVIHVFFTNIICHYTISVFSLQKTENKNPLLVIPCFSIFSSKDYASSKN